MKILVALGGNALMPPSGNKSFDTYQDTVKKTALSLSRIAKKHKLVITHGNGTQVGSLLLRQDDMPMDVLGAETQGQIGYLLQRELQNQLPDKEITTIVSQVLVDKNDSAFKNPTKPVGQFYSERPDNPDWDVKKLDHGWRRVVPSPKPKKIIELSSIKKLFTENSVPICCGGGGIPVVDDNGLSGVEAVIDKDATAVLLAKSLDVDLLLILTNVKGAYTDFNTKNQKFIEKLSVKEAEKHITKKTFGEGSMLPKVKASIDFAKTGKTVIAHLDDMVKAANGEAGTTIK